MASRDKKNPKNHEHMNNHRIAFIGAASGWGAQDARTELGPEAVQSTNYINKLINTHPSVHWQATIYPEKISNTPDRLIAPSDLPYEERLELVVQTAMRVAEEVTIAIRDSGFPIVIGGDHSIAVGTWAGVIRALTAEKKFGLIWFDAHMDSHTPQTTPSMAIHGMPVAALLGHGESNLVDLEIEGQKIDPRHLVIMGIRSYEPEEEALLKSLGVKLFLNTDIQAKGFSVVCQEALDIVTQGTEGFGLSIDLDGFDPQLVPGVGSPVFGGIDPENSLAGFSSLINDGRCKALEIAEFNPALDKEHKTIRVIEALIRQKIK